MTVDGLKELNAKLKNMAAETGNAMTKALMASGYVLETAVKTDMAQPKSGRRYGKHQASAPGESPAMDTGVLAASVMTEADGDGVLVGTNSEYAEPLEFGTARMRARPFMQPAAERSQGDMTDAAQKILKSLVEGAV